MAITIESFHKRPTNQHKVNQIYQRMVGNFLRLQKEHGGRIKLNKINSKRSDQRNSVKPNFKQTETASKLVQMVTTTMNKMLGLDNSKQSKDE